MKELTTYLATEFFQIRVDQGPYSPSILENVLSLVLKILSSLEAFECYATSDWPNHTVWPIRSCVTFKFVNPGEKDKTFLENGW